MHAKSPAAKERYDVILRGWMIAMSNLFCMTGDHFSHAVFRLRGVREPPESVVTYDEI